MMKLFPRDCTTSCEYFSCYDLSIDDIVFCCSKLNQECDAMYTDFTYTTCPTHIEEEDDQ